MNDYFSQYHSNNANSCFQYSGVGVDGSVGGSASVSSSSIGPMGELLNPIDPTTTGGLCGANTGVVFRMPAPLNIQSGYQGLDNTQQAVQYTQFPLRDHQQSDSGYSSYVMTTNNQMIPQPPNTDLIK